MNDIYKLFICKFDDEVLFMWFCEIRFDFKCSEVGLGGVKFVYVVNDREIWISLKVKIIVIKLWDECLKNY